MTLVQLFLHGCLFMMRITGVPVCATSGRVSMVHCVSYMLLCCCVAGSVGESCMECDGHASRTNVGICFVRSLACMACFFSLLYL